MTVLIDQQNEPRSAKKAPTLNAVLSSPKHRITPVIPKNNDKIFHLLSLSFKRKGAKIANHRGLVNKIIEDIEEDKPLDIARFKNPIVPIVCKIPITVTRRKPLVTLPLLLGITLDTPSVKRVSNNIKIPALINLQLPIRKGGAWFSEIKYLPVGNDDPIKIVVRVILSKNETLEDFLKFNFIILPFFTRYL